jgi:hypothetical protein
MYSRSLPKGCRVAFGSPPIALRRGGEGRLQSRCCCFVFAPRRTEQSDIDVRARFQFPNPLFATAFKTDHTPEGLLERCGKRTVLWDLLPNLGGRPSRADPRHRRALQWESRLQRHAARQSECKHTPLAHSCFFVNGESHNRTWARERTESRHHHLLRTRLCHTVWQCVHSACVRARPWLYREAHAGVPFTDLHTCATQCESCKQIGHKSQSTCFRHVFPQITQHRR